MGEATGKVGDTAPTHSTRATYPPCSRPGHSLANFMNMKLSMVSARLCAAVRPKFAYHEKMSCRCSCH